MQSSCPVAPTSEDQKSGTGKGAAYGAAAGAVLGALTGSGTKGAVRGAAVVRRLAHWAVMPGLRA